MNLIEKLKQKGVNLKNKEFIESLEGTEVVDSNKSKAKTNVLSKIKRFYYLHVYEKLSLFGNDEEYRDVLVSEKESLATEKELEEKLDDKLVSHAEMKPEKYDGYARNLLEKTDKLRKEIKEKNEKYQEKIDKIDESIRIEEEKRIAAEKEAEQIVDPDAIIAEVNEDIKKSIGEMMNDEIAEQEEIPGEVKIEEPKINQDVTPVENEETNKAFELDEEIKAIINKSVADAVNETKMIYENRFNAYREASENEMKNIFGKAVEKFTNEKNELNNEKEQYKNDLSKANETINDQQSEIERLRNMVKEYQGIISSVTSALKTNETGSVDLEETKVK